MEQLKRFKTKHFVITIVSIISILISANAGYIIQQKQRHKLAMDSTELVEKDGDDDGIQIKTNDHQQQVSTEWHLLSRKLGRTLPIIGIKAKAMPCCAESIGQHICIDLRNRNPLFFRKRCKTDADFAILQCCRSCRTNVAQLGRELFAAGPKSRHCFDRYNRHFCTHFVHQSGMWAANVGKSVNCNGDSASLAFRVCRRSCGFCDAELYQQQQHGNQNCISHVWKMTSGSNTTTTTTARAMKTSTAATQPQASSPSSSTKRATTSSSTTTKDASRTTSVPSGLVPTNNSVHHPPLANNHSSAMSLHSAAAAIVANGSGATCCSALEAVPVSSARVTCATQIADTCHDRHHHTLGTMAKTDNNYNGQSVSFAAASNKNASVRRDYQNNMETVLISSWHLARVSNSVARRNY